MFKIINCTLHREIFGMSKIVFNIIEFLISFSCTMFARKSVFLIKNLKWIFCPQIFCNHLRILQQKALTPYFTGNYITCLYFNWSIIFRPQFQLEEEPIKTFGVEEYISTKYFTPFDHKSLAPDPPNPKMGCTIVTQLSSSRPGQHQRL